MGKQFVIIPPYTRVFMPDNHAYDAGDTVVLSDAQYGRITAGMLRTFVVDDVTDVSDPVEPGTTGPAIAISDPAYATIDIAGNTAADFGGVPPSWLSAGLDWADGTTQTIRVNETGLYLFEASPYLRLEDGSTGDLDSTVSMTFGPEDYYYQATPPSSRIVYTSNQVEENAGGTVPAALSRSPLLVIQEGSFLQWGFNTSHSPTPSPTLDRIELMMRKLSS